MEPTPGKLFTVGSMVLTWYLYHKMPDRIHDEVERFITELLPRIGAYFNPYVTLTISEQRDGEQFRRNELFDNIAAYLTHKCADGSRRLKAELGQDGKSADITLDDVVRVTDDHNGARIWWYATNKGPSYRSPGPVISLYPAESEPRLFRAVFHKSHRSDVLCTYLPKALKKGRELIVEKTTQKLFTVHRQGNTSRWSHVPFRHPATFAKLAMDPVKKDDLKADLDAFREGEQFHSDVGKAWKRGYLLYGPPGTGKSTLISAMANELKYDVYDLDLTSVKNNAELRKLFLETKGKSIIVMEDIDAIQVDLTGNRMVDTKTCSKSSDLPIDIDPNKDDGSKVTLSGLLSFMDGLWSACGGERIIVFTTNHLEMLDPALTRRGRMDMHIEMSYCRFGAFKVLARNYLKLDGHELFGEIQSLLDDIDISPADVAHNLMPKSNKRVRDAEEVDCCLADLVSTLKKAKKESSSPKNAKKPSATTRRSLRRNQPRRQWEGGIKLHT